MAYDVEENICVILILLKLSNNQNKLQLEYDKNIKPIQKVRISLTYVELTTPIRPNMSI